MKYIIASDIHGSEKFCRMLLDSAAKENADRIILLGDLLYHGPRNDLPEGYNPKNVIALLNQVKEKLLCVRGNCDADVDQMVLEFPVMAEYAVIETNGRLVYLTHGHKYNRKTPLPCCKGDILINGHFHVPECEDTGTFIYMNDGSVSLPKENSPHTYMTLENGCFLWKDLLTGNVYMRYSIEEN